MSGVVSIEVCRFCGCGSSVASLRAFHRYTCGTSLDSITKEVRHRGKPCIKIEGLNAQISIMKDKIEELESDV